MSRKRITSQSSDVVRNLLYSMAEHIGQYTLLLVLYLTPNHISRKECCQLDAIISSDSFPHEDIERAAHRTINQKPITFGTFFAELRSR